MAPSNTLREADCSSPVRRCSGALLLLAITGMLVACGGGVEPASGVNGGTGVGGSGGGGGAVCKTGSTITQLTWDPVTNAAGYRVYVGTASRTYAQPFGQGVDVGNISTAPVPGLVSRTTYYFTVTAYDGAGESFYSNEVCKTTN